MSLARAKNKTKDSKKGACAVPDGGQILLELQNFRGDCVLIQH